MIRKRIKDVVIGLVVGSIVSTSLFGFAEMQTIQAYFNDIKIKINGNVVDTGTDKPFIYGGRTYIPTRYVAEGLGATVKWNETDNCVEIDSKNEQVVNSVTPTPTIVPTVAPTPIPQNISYVFRKVNWGMSMDQVVKNEGRADTVNQNGYLMYMGKSINGTNTNILYVFNQNRLCSIMLVPQLKHVNKNLYIDDYQSFKTTLIEKYGQSTLPVDMIWKNDLYKGDSNYYGMAVSAGHLKYTSSWETNDTIIYETLRGDNFEVELTILYKSKTIESPATDSGL